MKNAYILLILGVWLAILPYLGFPLFWKGVLTTISGLMVIFMSYMFFRQFKKNEINKKRTFENFSENNFESEE